MMLNVKLVAIILTGIVAISGRHLAAQGLGGQGIGGQGFTIQQPVVSVFNVNTVVAVPDGGTISLGGISGTSYGSTRRGVPFTTAPYLSRAFQNRGIGSATNASNASVSVKVIIMEELDAEVTAEGMRRAALRRATDPNGSAEVQQKADFISRNIGRKDR